MKNQIEIMHHNLFTEKVTDIVLSDSKQIINTLNAFSFVVAEKNVLFKQALQNSDILVADGFPIVLAARILKNKQLIKIAGADLFFHFMNLLNEKSGKAFFLGSSADTLQKIQKNASNDFENVSTFTDDDSKAMTEAINQINPDVVFVGMTAPKQECWVDANKHHISAKVICSIGAVFDFYAGTVKRAPKWMINAKLEWFYRLIKEPSRMWKRYLIYSPKFFYYLILFKLGVRK